MRIVVRISNTPHAKFTSTLAFRVPQDIPFEVPIILFIINLRTLSLKGLSSLSSLNVLFFSLFDLLVEPSCDVGPVILRLRIFIRLISEIYYFVQISRLKNFLMKIFILFFERRILVLPRKRVLIFLCR